MRVLSNPWFILTVSVVLIIGGLRLRIPDENTSGNQGFVRVMKFGSVFGGVCGLLAVFRWWLR